MTSRSELDRAYRSWREALPPFRYDGPVALVCVGFNHIWANRSLELTHGHPEASEAFLSRLRRAAANAADLLAAFRGASELVCHVNALPREDQLPFAGRDLRSIVGAAPRWQEDAEFLTGLEPRPLEPTVFPLSTNPLLDRSLERILRNAGIDAIVLAGVPGHITVQHIARSAHDLGFGCAVVRDAVASWQAHDEAAALETLDGVYCHVVDTATVRTAIEGRTPRAVDRAAADVGELGRLDPRATALLAIDVQYGSAHPAFGGIARGRGRGIDLTEYVQALPEAIDALRSVQQVCRRRGVEVIHVHIESLTEDGRDRSRGHKALGNLKRRQSIEGRILDAVAPQPDEIVLAKTCSSAIASGQLPYLLRNLGARHVLVGGVITSGCVESTIRDAFAEGFVPIVIEDACAAWCRDLHRSAIDAMRRLGIMTVRAADVEALFTGRVSADAPSGAADRA